jgi:hypothetical protein
MRRAQLAELLGRSARDAFDELERLDADTLLNENVDVLVHGLLARYLPEPVSVDWTAASGTPRCRRRRSNGHPWSSGNAATTASRAVAVSDKRNVDYVELLRTARGDRGVKFHETLMAWRHDHVAHRKSREFEAVAVYADYLDAAPDVLDAIRVSVSPSGGPADDSPFVVEFGEHVKALRDTLWEKYLAPIGELIATRGPRGVLAPAEPEPTEGLTVQQVLWSRHNGTGVG